MQLYIRPIIDLHKEMTEIEGKTEYFPIIDELFEKLKVEPKKLVQDLHLSENSVRRVLKKLSEEHQYIYQDKAVIERHLISLVNCLV